jgi:hypothetical protein
MERNSKKNSQKVLGFKFLEFGVCVRENSLKKFENLSILANYDQF